jgi:hypothetical protein
MLREVVRCDFQVGKNAASGSPAMLIANVHCVRFVSGKLPKGVKLGTKDVCR